jgi:hypothetical protein
VLVLEVRLPVVTDNPVRVGGGRCLLARGGNLSLMRIPQSLEKTLSEVHVADWVDALGELNGPGQLAVSVAPVVLNAL